MEQSSTIEADSLSADEEISFLLCNPNAHFHVHNSPPQDTIMSQLSPSHIFKPFFNMNFNNKILPCTPVSLGLFSLKLCNNFSFPPCGCNICTSRPKFDHPKVNLGLSLDLTKYYTLKTYPEFN
jgi:hypothetical protein